MGGHVKKLSYALNSSSHSAHIQLNNWLSLFAFIIYIAIEDPVEDQVLNTKLTQTLNFQRSFKK